MNHWISLQHSIASGISSKFMLMLHVLALTIANCGITWDLDNLTL